MFPKWKQLPGAEWHKFHFGTYDLSALSVVSTAGGIEVRELEKEVASRYSSKGVSQ